VMSEDERTQVMDSDRRQPQRYDEYDDDDPEAEAAAKRKRRTLIAVVAAVLVAVIVLLILFLNGSFKDSGTKAAVPDVTGQLLAPARDALQLKGFTNIVVKNVVCGGTPVAGAQTCTADQINKVIAMDPPASTSVLTTAPITLSVGTAPGQVQVPDLTGMTQIDAGTKLNQSQLTLDPNVQQVDVTDPAQVGKVQKQTPPPGTSAAPNSSVQITVGQLKQQANVPDVTGSSYSDAKSQLVGLGFKVQKTTQPGSQPLDTVTDQSIKGAPAPAGTTITLTVSDGSQAQITMPDVTGQTFAQAVATLQAKGWTGQANQRSDKSSDPSAGGTVTKPDPAAGSQISKSQAVSFYVAEGSGGSTTPTSPTGPPHFP
jgi:beta-lactam-binding protein with PASTA domain